MGLLFKKPTKEEIEKEITKKEIELSDLRKQLEQHKKRFNDWTAHNKSYPTPIAQAISQCEYRISRLEDQITDLKRQLLRL